MSILDFVRSGVWHNLRITDVKGERSTRYNLTVSEAAEDDVFAGNPLANIVKVEWKGAHIGEVWTDVTAFYQQFYMGAIDYAA